MLTGEGKGVEQDPVIASCTEMVGGLNVFQIQTSLSAWVWLEAVICFGLLLVITVSNISALPGPGRGSLRRTLPAV